MSVTLWNGWSTFALTSLHNNPQTCGLAWATSEDRTCTGCRFYRLAGMPSGQLPTRARVWRNSDGHVMADLALAPSTGADGWIDFDWTVPFTAAASVQYRLGIDFPGTFSYVASNPTTEAPAPPVPLSLQANGKYVQEPVGFPDITSSLWFAVDVVLAGDALAGAGGTAGTGGSTTTGDLNAWLSGASTVNTHQSDGLPWLIKAVVDRIAGATGSTAGQLDATKTVSDAIHDLLTSSNKNLGTLWDLAGHLTDLELAAYKALFGDGAARLTGPNSAGGSAFYTADGDLVSQLVAEIWQRVRVLRGDVGFGTAGWTMTATSDFDTSIAFAEPADAYTLSVTSYRPSQPASSVAAGLWLYRVGWWCVLTGSYASQRAYVDFQQQLLSDQGRRMPGCAIQLKPGTLGTVQAWQLA